MSLRVGAHVSISASRASNDPETPPHGNIANAVFRQTAFGGNCGQIFTHSPQVWEDPNVDTAEAEQFRSATETDLDGPWVIHTSYLVNLCTPKDGLREKSLQSMQREVDAADQLGIPYVNVHLGAHTGAGVEGGLDNAAGVVDAIDVPSDVTILIESDAGAGTKLGGEFEHLAGIIDRTDTDIDVCLDTAHVFAAGYDLSSPGAVDETVEAFDDVVGLDHLRCIHLNDSKHDCGTNKDEHAHIGEGLIGEAGMERIVNHPDLQSVPLVLETPTEDGKSFAWNIERVRSLRRE